MNFFFVHFSDGNPNLPTTDLDKSARRVLESVPISHSHVRICAYSMALLLLARLPLSCEGSCIARLVHAVPLIFG